MTNHLSGRFRIWRALTWPPVLLLHIVAPLLLMPVWTGETSPAPRRVTWLLAAYACVAAGWWLVQRREAVEDPSGRPVRSVAAFAVVTVAMFGIWAVCWSKGIDQTLMSLSRWIVLASLIGVGLTALLKWWSPLPPRAWEAVLAWSLIIWPLLLTLLRLPRGLQDYPAESRRALLNVSVLIACTCGLGIWGVAYFPLPKRLRSVFAKLLILACSCGAVLLATECVFRMSNNFGYNLWEVYDPGCGTVVGQPHATAGWKGQFGTAREFVARHSTNSIGFNDREHDLRRPKGARRVAVFGDSFVEAIQVDQNEGLTALLEERLQKSMPEPVEVLNFGRAGWGQVQELDALKKHGLGYAPDLVIVEFLAANDVRNNYQPLEDRSNTATGFHTQGTIIYDLARRWKLQSVGLGLLRVDRLCVRGCWVDGEGYQDPPYSAEWEQAWKNTYAALAEFQRSCRKVNATLLVVAFGSVLEIAAYSEGQTPSLNQVNDRGEPRDFTAPNRYVEKWCHENHVAFLNLPQAFARLPQPVRDAIHYKVDWHWAPTGHREAARLIADHVVKNSLLHQ